MNPGVDREDDGLYARDLRTPEFPDISWAILNTASRYGTTTKQEDTAILLDEMSRNPYDDTNQPGWAYDQPTFTSDIENRESYDFPNLPQLPPSRELKSPQPYRENEPVDHEPRNRGNDSNPDSETVTRPDASTVQDLVNEGPQKETNYESFAAAIKARRPWMFEAFKDQTDPPNPEDQALVCELVRAIKSTDYAKDNANMISPFKTLKKHNDQRIEFAAWKILTLMRISSRGNITSLRADDEIKMKPATEFLSFEERFTKARDILETRKTICKHLLDPPYISCFVDDPVGSEKRVISNKNLNKRKKNIMEASKRVIKEHPLLGSTKKVGRPQSDIVQDFVPRRSAAKPVINTGYPEPVYDRESIGLSDHNINAAINSAYQTAYTPVPDPTLLQFPEMRSALRATSNPPLLESSDVLPGPSVHRRTQEPSQSNKRYAEEYEFEGDDFPLPPPKKRHLGGSY